MRELVDLVTTWGVAKGILERTVLGQSTQGDTIAQLKKCSEEVIETAQAYQEAQCFKSEHLDLVQENLKLELGDIGVTWIMSCRAAGIDPEEALGAAYNKIQFRTGEMKDGQFVKNEEGC